MINKDFSLLPIDYPSNLILDRHTLKINSNHTKLRHLQSNHRCKGMLENLVHNMRMSYLHDKRQKAQEEMKRYQLGKENFGIYIESYKRITHDTSMEKKEPSDVGDLRASSVHSKTFKIRFNTKKNPTKKSSFLHTIPHKPALKENTQESTYHHLIPCTPIHLPSLHRLSQSLHCLTGKKPTSRNKSDWGILIPSILLIKQYLWLRQKLYILFTEGVNIYGISHSKEQAINIQQIYDFMDILYAGCKTEIQKYVLFCSDEIMPDYLLLLNLKEIGPLWIPGFPNAKQYIFLRCDDCKFFADLSIDHHYNKISFTHSKQKLEIICTQHDRQLQQKLSFETQSRKIRNMSNPNSTSPNLSSFHNQMTSFVDDTQTKPKQKQKSNNFLTQLINNNKSINKQIQRYWEQNKCLQIPQCTPMEKLAIEYYVL